VVHALKCGSLFSHRYYVLKLTLVDGSCRGPGLKVVIIGESLSTVSFDLNDGDFISRLVCTVCLLKGASVLGADGREDLIRLLDGGGLLALEDSAGVEQDEGVLLGGDGPKAQRASMGALKIALTSG